MTGETSNSATDSEGRPATDIADTALREAMRLPDGAAIARLKQALEAAVDHVPIGSDVVLIPSILEALVIRLAGARQYDEALARYRDLAWWLPEPAVLAPVQSSLVTALIEADHPGAAEVALAYATNPLASCHQVIRIFIWSLTGDDRGSLVRRIAAEGKRPCIKDPIVSLLYRLGLYQAAHLDLDHADALIAMVDPAPLDPWSGAKAVCHLLRAKAYEVQGRLDSAIEETSAATRCAPGNLESALLHLGALTRAGRIEDRAAWYRRCKGELPDGHPVRAVAELIVAPCFESAVGVVSVFESEGGLPSGAGRDLLLGALQSVLLPRLSDRQVDLDAKGLLAGRLENIIGPVAWSGPINAARSLARMQQPPAGSLGGSLEDAIGDALSIPILKSIASIAAGDPSALEDACEETERSVGIDSDVLAFFVSILAVLRRIRGVQVGLAPIEVPDRLLVPFPWLAGVCRVCGEVIAWCEGHPCSSVNSDLPVDGWAGLIGCLLKVGDARPERVSAAAERYLDESMEFSVLWATISWIEMRSGILPQSLVAKAYAVLVADPRLVRSKEPGMCGGCRELRLALLGHPPSARPKGVTTLASPLAGEEPQDLLSHLSGRIYAADREYLAGRRLLRTGDAAGAFECFQSGGTNSADPLDRLVGVFYASVRAYWSAIALGEMGCAKKADAMLAALRNGPYTCDVAVLECLQSLQRGDIGEATSLLEKNDTSSALDYIRGLQAVASLLDHEAAAAVSDLAARHEPPHHRYAALLWGLNGRLHERIGMFEVASEAYSRALQYGLDSPPLIRGMLRCDIQRIRRGEPPGATPAVTAILPDCIAPYGSIAATLYSESEGSGSDPLIDWLRASVLLARGNAEGAELVAAGIKQDPANDSPMAAFREAALIRRIIIKTLVAGPPAIRIEGGGLTSPSTTGPPGTRFWRILGAMYWEHGRVVTPDAPLPDNWIDALPDQYRSALRLLTAPTLSATGANTSSMDREWTGICRYLTGQDQDLLDLDEIPPILDRSTVVAESIRAHLRVGTNDSGREKRLIEAASSLADGDASCRRSLIMLLLHRACDSDADNTAALDDYERASALTESPSKSPGMIL